MGRCNNLADRQCVESWARGRAVAALTHAMELYPGFTAARNTLANVLRDQGRLMDAIAGYRDAIDHGGGTDAYFGLGTTLSRMPGRLSQAAASFAMAATLAEKDNQSPAIARWELGRIYFQQSRAARDSGRRSACLIRACDELAKVHLSWTELRDYKEDEDFAAFNAACPRPWHVTDVLWDLVAYVSRSSQPTCKLPQ